MVTTSEARVEASIENLGERTSWIAIMGDLIRRKPLGAAGGLIVIIMVVAGIFAPIIAPFDPLVNDYARPHFAPNLINWLGTDQFGRDILSRIIYGARTALLIGFVSAAIGGSLGLVLGVASAYFGGLFDLILQRIMDVLMAFPLIILALAMISILGRMVNNDILLVIIAITIPFVPRCARVVRSSALAIREIPYVDAARACGFSHTRIILRHMTPNVMAPFLIMITAFVGQAILLEASLSFLGLGVQDPLPAWGLMLRNAQEFIRTEPWIAIWPGVAISLGVFGFNLFGDAVRDALDPKLRSQ